MTRLRGFCARSGGWGAQSVCTLSRVVDHYTQRCAVLRGERPSAQRRSSDGTSSLPAESQFSVYTKH
eukprot:1279542-Pleurochrysis_carterae.AAC.4